MKPKNKAAQALRKLAKSANMARSYELARKAGLARWKKLNVLAKPGTPLRDGEWRDASPTGNPNCKFCGGTGRLVRHAEGEVEHSLCGMAFDAYDGGYAEEPIIFAKPGEVVTCQECRAHIDFVRGMYRAYRYVPNNPDEPTPVSGVQPK